MIIKKYTHQLTVTEKCFISCDLDEIREFGLKRYLKHELFILFGMSVMFTRLCRSDSADEMLCEMWDRCIRHNPKWARYFRYRTPLALICLPGRGGRAIAIFFYRLANKIVRFN